MGELEWLEQLFHPGPELAVPRRFLVLYLTTLTGDQFKVLFAVYPQWQLGDRPLSFRVKPQEIGRLCDLSIMQVHRLLNQLVQIGYLDGGLASDLDGYRMTIPSPSQVRE